MPVSESNFMTVITPRKSFNKFCYILNDEDFIQDATHLINTYQIKKNIGVSPTSVCFRGYGLDLNNNNVDYIKFKKDVISENVKGWAILVLSDNKYNQIKETFINTLETENDYREFGTNHW